MYNKEAPYINYQYTKLNVITVPCNNSFVIVNVYICTYSYEMYLIVKVSYIRNTPSEEEEEQKRLIKEVSMMAKLQHPNIVRCLGATQQPGCFNIFLEWMAGKAAMLQQYSARNKDQNWSTVFKK